MKILLRLLMTSALILISSAAQAGLYGSVDAFYLSDSFTTTRSDTNSRTYYSLDLIANLDQKSKFYAGFHVHQFDSQDVQGSNIVALNSLDMGPFLKWVIDRKKVFALSLGYNISAKATYKNGSTNSNLDGTSVLASFDITPEVSENLYVGVKFNYLAMTYVQSVTGSTTANVSYSRNIIFPTLSLSWRR